MDKKFSGFVTVFHELRLPQTVRPVGYAVVIDAYELGVFLPYKLSCIGTSHSLIDLEEWSYFSPRHAPEASQADVVAALKHEGVDLPVLKW